MTQRSHPIEFWFDFSSPYAYFAAAVIDDRMARFGRTVEWKPILLGVVLKMTGMTPLMTTPLRGAYARHDWARLSRIVGVPFDMPETDPYPSQTVARAYYWLRDRFPDLAVPFAKRAFHAHFADRADLASIPAVVALADGFKCDTAGLADWLGSAAAKERLRAATVEAVARGVFGSPFFVADGEPFWGWDRIPMLEDWLRHGAWPAAARG